MTKIWASLRPFNYISSPIFRIIDRSKAFRIAFYQNRHIKLDSHALRKWPESHRKVTGMLVVSLWGINCGFWSHLGCLGRKVTIQVSLRAVHKEIYKKCCDVCFSMVSLRLGVTLSLSHTHTGLP